MQYDKMNVRELRAFAGERGILLPGRLNKKDDIIQFIVNKLQDPKFLEKQERNRQLRIRLTGR